MRTALRLEFKNSPSIVNWILKKLAESMGKRRTLKYGDSRMIIKKGEKRAR